MFHFLCLSLIRCGISFALSSWWRPGRLLFFAGGSARLQTHSVPAVVCCHVAKGRCQASFFADIRITFRKYLNHLDLLLSFLKSKIKVKIPIISKEKKNKLRKAKHSLDFGILRALSISFFLDAPGKNCLPVDKKSWKYFVSMTIFIKCGLGILTSTSTVISCRALFQCTTAHENS